MSLPLAPCEPALALAPAEKMVLPYTSVLLTASGGTGAYRFALAGSDSDGSVNESTGVYLSGALQDHEDRVVVTDLGCRGQAAATMRVVAGLEVAPRAAELTPGTGFTFDISGGSGSYACSIRAAASGGSVSQGCAYSAGAETGVDVVRIVDVETGYHVDATMQVHPDARLEIAGSGRLFVPLGQGFRAEALGGSGYLMPAVLSGGLMVNGTAIIGSVAGDGQVRFADRYTGMSIDVPVTVVPPYTPDVERDGERSSEGVVHSVGDLNGDGYPDGVLGFIELSVSAHYSGAVMVYKGGPAGLEPEPVQVFHGTTRIETFGRDVEIADIDGDGQPDLLVGADRSDQGLVNNGAVMIYGGVRGGFFSKQPIRVLKGDRANDRFGANLVACDFDGDGYPDLAVGALEAEDINVGSPAYEQGAVHVFRGSATGFTDKADFVLYGRLPDAGGTFRSAARMRLGQTVRAGDLDGDGRCDLVVGAPVARRDSSGEDGVVLVYQGTSENNLVLTRTPVRMYAANDNGEFGNAIELGDINGDGKDDMVIAHYLSSTMSDRGGSAHVFLGGSLTDRPPSNPITPEEAAWTVHGTTSSENLGADVALVDFDGDAYADLLIGVARWEALRRYDTGAVRGYAGAAIRAAVAANRRYDATNDVATLVVPGLVSGGRLGQAVGAVGRGGILALAGWDDTYGTEVGAPYYASMSKPDSPQLLQLPGEAAGHEFGQGIALFDVDGDGDRDLLIGGPGAAEPRPGANAGLLFYYLAEGTSFADTPVKFANENSEPYPNHDGSDRYGFAISTAGDFNGDGLEDLAVVARGESRPDGACGVALARSGAVYVYLGQPTGLDRNPAFVVYGPTADGNIRTLRGGLDVNDDGYGDLLVGGFGWGSAGGFAIVHGRPASATPGVVAICDAELYMGVENNSYLGSAVASLGDLDGDGCDDVAVGASREDFGIQDQGSVRIVWGWGGRGCSSSPEVTTMVLTLPFTQLGTALDGGRDVDGDGITDLAVGGASFRYDFGYVGAAWVVPGAYLLGLARQSITPGQLPASASTVLATLLPVTGERGRYGVLGPVAASLFGDAVALIPDPVVPGRAALAVGAPRGNYGGSSLAGGVAIYRFTENALNGQPGLAARPYAIMGGEVATTPSLLGATLQGYEVDGRPVLLVGAPVSNARGLDLGAGFVLRF